MYKVEKDIPIPYIPSMRGCKPMKYPLDRMEIGDSFFIACDENMIQKVMSRIKTCSVAYRKRSRRDVSFRSLGFVNGVRTWRIK